MIASYEFYCARYCGSMAEEEYRQATAEAEAYVDMITFGRVRELESIPDEVKFAVCAAADVIHRRAVQQSNGVKSQTNHNVSVTYDTQSVSEYQSEMMDKARMHLANTGLLYCGVY